MRERGREEAGALVGMGWFPIAILLISASGCVADEHSHVVSAV